MSISKKNINTEKEKEEIPHAKLVRAEEVSEPEIKAWHFSDLKQDEVKKIQKIRSDVLENMRREAEPELVRQTTLLKKETFEKAHQEGYEVGFKKGLELGKKQTLEKTEKIEKEALGSLVKRLEDLWSFMQRPFKNIEDKVLQSFADLSLEIAEKFIKDKISKDENWILKAVQGAIKMLPEETVLLNIELNPEDIAILDKYQQDFSQNWQLKSNPVIPVGSCRVKQDFSVVESIWQDQLADFLSKISDQIQVRNSRLSVDKSAHNLEDSAKESKQNVGTTAKVRSAEID